MGIRSNAQGNVQGYFERKVSKKFNEFLDQVEFDMEEIMTDAETEMRHNISDRGVVDTIPNNNGRGTGAMENATDHRVTRVGDIIQGKFGWLGGSRKPEYGWQESGTLDHGSPSGMPSPVPGTNRGILPMLALKDAEDHAAQELARRFQGRRSRG